VLLTPVANGQKLSSRNVLNILFGHFLVVEFPDTVDTFFFFKLTKGYKQSDIFAIICHYLMNRNIATGITNPDGKFSAVVNDT
jgi:hypothetical protein